MQPRRSLQADREIVLAAVRQNGLALIYAWPLQSDRKIVLAAVRKNGKALAYAAFRLRADRKIVLAAVQRNGKVFKRRKRAPLDELGLTSG